jgi:hypothetical protein
MLSRFHALCSAAVVSKLGSVKAEKSLRRNSATSFTRPASSLAARGIDDDASYVLKCCWDYVSEYENPKTQKFKYL